MKSIRVAVEHTAETIHPMHAFVCESPAVDREVLLEGTAGDGARTLVFYVEGDADAYEAVLAAQSDVEDYAVHRDGGDAFFLSVRAANRETDEMFLDAFDREMVVVVPPIEFRSDRTMVLSLVGDADALRDVLAAVPDDLGVEILAIGTTPATFTPALTDRQRAALEVAWDVGYYDVPRTGGIEAVAGELDCAVSTASTLLRRAEAALVGDALGAVD